jgi:hypothetical protein
MLQDADALRVELLEVLNLPSDGRLLERLDSPHRDVAGVRHGLVARHVVALGQRPHLPRHRTVSKRRNRRRVPAGLSKRCDDPCPVRAKGRCRLSVGVVECDDLTWVSVSVFEEKPAAVAGLLKGVEVYVEGRIRGPERMEHSASVSP